jgi:hypothetical protein
VYAIHRILVAIKDPRARAIPAIAKAAQLARALGAEVRLFHAIPGRLSGYCQLDSASLAQLEQRQSRAYQRRLERWRGAAAARARGHDRSHMGLSGARAVIRRDTSRPT